MQPLPLLCQTYKVWQVVKTNLIAGQQCNVVIAVQMCPEGLAGIEIKVDGFSHKLSLLVQYIFKQLVDLKINPSCFERVQEGLLRRYKNANMKPDKHATYLRIYTIKEKLWPVEAVQAEVEALKPSDLQGEHAYC